MGSWNTSFRRWIAGLALVVMALPQTSAGEDFRVDTEMFKNQDKAPFVESLTIFADGIVYDFCLTEPVEATVFDRRNGRFTLLDEKRKVKATVTTQELLDFSLALETQAAKAQGLFAFSAAPQFETTEKEIESNGQTHVELRLTGKSLTYVAVGERPERKEAVTAYRHFTDWCARLNATRRGNLPPGARLALNQALAEHGLLPLEILRTTIEEGVPLPRKLEIKSQHRANWTLSGEDRKKIDRAADMMATFRAISYDDYRNPTSKAGDAKQVRR